LFRDLGVIALDGRWFQVLVRGIVGCSRVVDRRSFTVCLQLGSPDWIDLVFILLEPAGSFNMGQVQMVVGRALLVGAILVCPFNVHFTSLRFMVCP
jgi:hypothetical protein